MSWPGPSMRTAFGAADARRALWAPEDDPRWCVVRCPTRHPARWTGRCEPSVSRGIRRSKGIRTTIPAKDGRRAGDLLNRDFTAAAPNRTWVMDFTYVRAWVGFVYVAFIVDVFAQTDRRLERREREGHRPGDEPAADGDLATRRERPSDRAWRADRPLGCRSRNTRRSVSPSTSRSRVSDPRSAPSATRTTTP